MRIRTLALAVTLACGVTGVVQAKPKTHSRKTHRTVKPRKVKPPKVKHHA